MKHERSFNPMPIGGRLRGKCKCGWQRDFLTAGFPDAEAAANARETAFVEHIPVEDRSVGLMVDATPGAEFAAVMPEGAPAALVAHWEEDGVRMGRITDGRILPVLIVMTADGRVFKLDEE